VTTLAEAVAERRPIAGGDINDAYDARLRDGRRAFVKTRGGVPEGEYAAEAAGLRWLGEGGARVPEVLAVGSDFLALEWIESGRLDPAGEEALGRELAATHEAGAAAFGGGGVLHLGPLLLPNDPCDDWPTFYAENRLRPLVARAGVDAALFERVCARLPELAGPPEPPARLHGDLWSGNVLPGADGRPWLIDPAAYGGHREVDLAMLKLFGGVGGDGSRTLAAYEEIWPLADGHEDRVALWQLFPLLVHAALFGGGYASSAERAARRYV
jgi:fructosamine-3-kinase